MYSNEKRGVRKERKKMREKKKMRVRRTIGGAVDAKELAGVGSEGAFEVAEWLEEESNKKIKPCAIVSYSFSNALLQFFSKNLFRELLCFVGVLQEDIMARKRTHKVF